LCKTLFGRGKEMEEEKKKEGGALFERIFYGDK
jgi:hypothetical protein